MSDVNRPKYYSQVRIPKSLSCVTQDRTMSKVQQNSSAFLQPEHFTCGRRLVQTRPEEQSIQDRIFQVESFPQVVELYTCCEHFSGKKSGGGREVWRWTTNDSCQHMAQNIRAQTQSTMVFATTGPHNAIQKRAYPHSTTARLRPTNWTIAIAPQSKFSHSTTWARRRKITNKSQFPINFHC